MTNTSAADAPETLRSGADATETGRHPAVEFDWDGDNLDRLRRMMSRIDVDMETALQVFFNGAPGRYNMIAKHDLPSPLQARCNLLDSIHRRIVCGFYLPDPERGLGRAHDMMHDWIADQDSEGKKGRVGRWVFERSLLSLKLTSVSPRMPEPTPVHETVLANLKNRIVRLVRRDRRNKPVCELDS